LACCCKIPEQPVSQLGFDKEQNGGVHAYDDCKKTDETAISLNMTQQGTTARVERAPTARYSRSESWKLGSCDEGAGWGLEDDRHHCPYLLLRR
jgi:hypothetical protein